MAGTDGTASHPVIHTSGSILHPDFLQPAVIISDLFILLQASIHLSMIHALRTILALEEKL